MRYQGRIIEWNEARGFGFLRRQGEDDGKVFAHVKAFTTRGRPPRIGDLVSYAIERDDRGRPRASAIEVVAPASGRAPVRRAPAPPAMPLTRLLWLVAAVVVATLLATTNWGSIGAALETFIAPPSPPADAAHRIALPVAESQAATAFRCSGKRYCSQMRSCAEATFYLRNCPGALSDGDGDGIPCEDQWCGH